jgi:hypothetical protein
MRASRQVFALARAGKAKETRHCRLLLSLKGGTPVTCGRPREFRMGPPSAEGGCA